MSTPELPAGHRALLAATEGVLREVVELHAPVPTAPGSRYADCNGCDTGAYAESPADWPCSTVQLIADQLGVSLAADAYVVGGQTTDTEGTDAR